MPAANVAPARSQPSPPPLPPVRGQRLTWSSSQAKAPQHAPRPAILTTLHFPVCTCKRVVTDSPRSNMAVSCTRRPACLLVRTLSSSSASSSLLSPSASLTLPLSSNSPQHTLKIIPLHLALFHTVLPFSQYYPSHHLWHFTRCIALFVHTASRTSHLISNGQTHRQSQSPSPSPQHLLYSIWRPERITSVLWSEHSEKSRRRTLPVHQQRWDRRTASKLTAPTSHHLCCSF